jgi:pilus assembly protein CpaC
VGKTVLVDLAKPISRVSVGLGDVAEVQAISRTEIMVMGKTPGQTSLIVWDNKGGRQFFNVTVRAGAYEASDTLDAVRRELRTELPGQTLRVSAEGGNIFLRGTVRDLNSSDRAVKIASIAGKVVNLLDVDVPPADPQILLKVRFMSVDRSKSKELGINLSAMGLGNTVDSLSTSQFGPSVTNLSSTYSTAGNTFSARRPVSSPAENTPIRWLRRPRAA